MQAQHAGSPARGRKAQQQEPTPSSTARRLLSLKSLSLLSFLVTATAVARLPTAAAVCYYPDGSSANDVACTDETDDSACCGTGYACFGVTSQYFLCKSTGDELQKDGSSTYVRGSCTDSTWRSSNCPSVCVEEGRDYLAGGNGVGKCPNSNTEYYCISTGLGEENCTTGYDLIDFAATPSAVTTIGVAASSSSSSSSSSSTSKSTTSSSSSATTTASVAATTTSSPDATASSTASSTAPAATTTAAASSGLTSGAKAGVGVGVGVGIPIILLAGLFLFLRRRKQSKAQNIGTAAAGGYAAAPQSPPGGNGNIPMSPMSAAPTYTTAAQTPGGAYSETAYGGGYYKDVPSQYAKSPSPAVPAAPVEMPEDTTVTRAELA